ncbi:hypothetical protein [Thermomonas sp.]
MRPRCGRCPWVDRCAW